MMQDANMDVPIIALMTLYAFGTLMEDGYLAEMTKQKPSASKIVTMILNASNET